MNANVFMTISSGVILLLGLAHLLYTFFGTKLMPRDAALQASMKLVSPIITKETNMWKSWVGFNASHSLGAILFGLIYGYLSIWHSVFLFASHFLLLVGFSLLASLVVLAKLYWFSIPFRGISIAFACYSAALVIYFT
jgi:hypothetical protein